MKSPPREVMMNDTNPNFTLFGGEIPQNWPYMLASNLISWSLIQNMKKLTTLFEKKTLHDMLVGCHTGSSKQHLLILGESSQLVSGHLLTGMILQVIGTKQQTAVRTDCCSNEEAHILSYTPGKLASRPWKMVVGRPCGFVLGPGNFPGSTLNFGGCTTILI